MPVQAPPPATAAAAVAFSRPQPSGPRAGKGGLAGIREAKAATPQVANLHRQTGTALTFASLVTGGEPRSPSASVVDPVAWPCNLGVGWGLIIWDAVGGECPGMLVLLRLSKPGCQRGSGVGVLCLMQVSDASSCRLVLTAPFSSKMRLAVCPHRC